MLRGRRSSEAEYFTELVAANRGARVRYFRDAGAARSWLGFAYGGVMPLYAVLAREYFAQHIMGTVLGTATMVASLGMALGPLGGGWIFDRFGGYAWLYLGSFALGLGAVAIALAFPPVRRPAQLQPA